LWIFLALGAGISFGLGPVILGKTSFYGFPVSALLFNGVLGITLLLTIYEMMKSKKENGYYWKWEHSNFRDPKGNGIRFSVVGIVILDSAVNVLILWLTIMTFKSSILAQLNQGVVTSLFSLNSIFMAIIGIVVFREKMHFNHYVGIILLLACSLLISFADDGTKQSDFSVMNN
jgi:MFS family permease